MTNGTTYYYKVRAVNAVGSGPLSNEVYGTPQAACAVPYITGISPIQPQVNPSRQWITILGSNFTSGSTVTLFIGGSTYPIPSDRTQYINSGQINVYVGLTETGTWSAQVTNPGGYSSNIFYFQVVT